MDDVVILNRRNVGDYVEKLKVDFILISISSPEDDFVRITENPHCKGILRLRFHDVVQEKRGKVYFRRKHAKRIKRFVSKHDASLLVCHCNSGVSRSPAVGAAISRVYGLDAERFFTSRGYIPNLLVFRRLLEVYGVNNVNEEVERFRKLFVAHLHREAGL
jgi:predicted protein tyrosine phosphatase